MLGNGRLEVQCFDGEKRLAHIRGKMRKKVTLDFQEMCFTYVTRQGLDQSRRYRVVVVARL